MAERRMFAKTIIDSDEFLDMPLSTQALYFHLSMRADDDGFINNPKKIQRSIGATDGDAALLVAKKFIIPFASGVVVIKHWRINNYLRNDRYHETVYQEEKKALSIKKNGAYTLGKGDDCQPVGIPVVDQRYTEDSIDKDSIGKDSILLAPSASAPVADSPSSPSKSEKKPQKQVPYQKILEMYYELCPSMSKVRPVNKYTDEIKRSVKARYAEYTIEDFTTVFKKAEASDFLNNRSDVTFQASFDWLMRPKNFSKALNGNFDNITKKPKETIKGTNIAMSIVADGTREDSPEPEVRFE